MLWQGAKWRMSSLGFDMFNFTMEHYIPPFTILDFLDTWDVTCCSTNGKIFRFQDCKFQDISRMEDNNGERVSKISFIRIEKSPFSWWRRNNKANTSLGSHKKNQTRGDKKQTKKEKHTLVWTNVPPVLDVFLLLGTALANGTWGSTWGWCKSVSIDQN